MFTVVLLLVAFALIAAIVSSTTRRRPRPPVSPIHFSHGVDGAAPVDTYVLAAVESPGDDTDCGGEDDACDCDADSGGDCDSGDSGDSGGPD